MDNTELAEIWKELKSLRQLVFQNGMWIYCLQRTLDAFIPGFREQRLNHERTAREFYSPTQGARLHEIDDIIRRLESSGSPRR